VTSASELGHRHTIKGEMTVSLSLCAGGRERERETERERDIKLHALTAAWGADEWSPSHTSLMPPG
jgi:hypothetical protein